MAEEANRDRNQGIDRLNVFINWVGTQPYVGMNAYQLRIRLDRANIVFATLETHNRLATGYAASDAARNDLWTAFYDAEERFLDASAIVVARIAELNEQTAAAAAAANPQGVAQQAGNANAVPPLNPAAPVFHVNVPVQYNNISPTWGTFDGNLLNWHDFKNRFKAAIHDVVAMPAADKMLYLRDALQGDAIGTLSGFGFDPANYQQAWDALVAQYERRYPLACAYLRQFFALPKLKSRPAAADLQRMSSEANRLLRLLRTLDYPTDHLDLVVVHALQERLSGELQTKWDTERRNDDNPTIARMLQFINDQASAITNQGLVQTPLVVTVPNEHFAGTGAPSSRRPPIGAVGGGPQRYPCPVCGTFNHKVFDCPDFKPLSYNQRMSIVRHNNMCVNCLKRGHYKDDCFDLNRCKHKDCAGDNKHNSMLCPYRVHPVRASTAQFDSPSSPSRNVSDTARSRGRGKPLKRSGSQNAS